MKIRTVYNIRHELFFVIKNGAHLSPNIKETFLCSVGGIPPLTLGLDNPRHHGRGGSWHIKRKNQASMVFVL